MDADAVKQIVDGILESLEPLETQTAAVVQFLKAKGIATDEELAPFLEQAGNAANVRWRGVRVRTAALISKALKGAEDKATKRPIASEASTQKMEVSTKDDGQRADREAVAQNNDTTPARESSEQNEDLSGSGPAHVGEPDTASRVKQQDTQDTKESQRAPSECTENEAA